MIPGKRLVSLIILLLILFTTVEFGCTPAKKPNPQRPFMPTEPYRISKPARNVTELHNLNNRLSNAVNEINNISRATVVVLDTSAFIGLELTKGLSQQQVTLTKKKAADKVKIVERKITSTWVTTKPAAITLIDRARADIKAGKPSSQYSRKLRLILDNSELVK